MKRIKISRCHSPVSNQEISEHTASVTYLNILEEDLTENSTIKIGKLTSSQSKWICVKEKPSLTSRLCQRGLKKNNQTILRRKEFLRAGSSWTLSVKYASKRWLRVKLQVEQDRPKLPLTIISMIRCVD